MSSIDKGIRDIANDLDSRIQVRHQGDQIIGTINGEVVFSVTDRYGYVNSYERSLVVEGVVAYKERKRREREAYELAKIEEQRRKEREEQERLERARIQAIAEVNDLIVKKRSLVESQRKQDLEKVKIIQSRITKLKADLITVQNNKCGVDINYISNKIREVENKVNSNINLINQYYDSILSEIKNISSKVNNNISTEEANKLKSQINKLKVIIELDLSSNYEIEKIDKEIKSAKVAIEKISSLASTLETFKNCGGRIEILVDETISKIKNTKFSSISDLNNLIDNFKNSLFEIKRELELEQFGQNDSVANELVGVIKACDEIKVLISESTYQAKDYRQAIQSAASNLIDQLNEVFDKEETTIDFDRITSILERLKDILSSESSNQETLKEIENLENEYKGLLQKDEIDLLLLKEYNKIKEELLKYGVKEEDIASFNADNYSDIKSTLKEQLKTAKREHDLDVLNTAYLETTMIMEEMGYEVFYRYGDDNIRETLFTRPGYDGVLWQIIVLPDGSINRRIIGVNKGDTQTDIEYVIEVAKEMDEKGDSIEFIKKYQKLKGGPISVETAVEHDSENVREVIMQNGYFDVSGEHLETYNAFVQMTDRTGKPITTVSRQIACTIENRIGNSSETVAAMRQMYLDNKDED